MTRKIVSLLLVVTTLTSLLALTSCHGNKALDPFVMPESFDETKQYEITFWAKCDTNIRQTKVYQKAIENFEALYPNINVTLKIYTDYQRIYNDVITNISTRTTPNVCITYPDHIATYMQGKNVVAPLDSLINDGRYGLGGTELKYDSVSKDEIVPKFLAEGTLLGEQYALPFVRSSEVIYINKTYVEKLGYTLPEDGKLTWDFVWEVSEAATAKDENGKYIVNGQEVMIPFIYKSTDNMMIQMIAQLGADYSNDEGDILIFNDDTKDILYTAAEHASTGAFSTFKISSYPANYLNAGQCVFAIDSTAGAEWMGADAPLSDIHESMIVDFETVVLPLPQFETDSAPEIISQGPSVCIFNKEDPGEVLASWLFAQYLLTDDVQIGYAKTEGYIPVTYTAQQNAEYLDYLSRAGELDENGDSYLYYSIKIAATKILLENVESTFITPVFNGSASLRNAAGFLIEDVVRGVRAVPPVTVDEEYIDGLYTKASSLYHLNDYTPESNSSGTILLICIAAAWVGLGTLFILERIKILKKVKNDKNP